MNSRQPLGYTTVAPWVVTDDTGDFLTFVSTAFDGVELSRFTDDHGSIGHAEIRVGDTVILAFDRRREWSEMPSLLRVWVTDADHTMARAVSAGAVVITEPSDSAFGQRGGRVRDPFGNIWWVAAYVEDVPEDALPTPITRPRRTARFRSSSSNNALLRWGIKRRSGFRIHPEGRAVQGADYRITAGWGRFEVVEPVRVVAFVAAERRCALAYGTLDGHPVAGEEAFILHRDQADGVFLTLRSLTRPAPKGLWRLAFPGLLMVQRAVRRRYLRALRA